jgi:hypothetical protein
MFRADRKGLFSIEVSCIGRACRPVRSSLEPEREGTPAGEIRLVAASEI